MATPGYRSNNGMKPERTPQQQKNVDMKRAEQNEYARQARNPLTASVPGKPTRPGSIPGIPGNSLTRMQSKYHADNTPVKKPGMMSRMHTAVGRQFRKGK